MKNYYKLIARSFSIVFVFLLLSAFALPRIPLVGYFISGSTTVQEGSSYDYLLYDTLTDTFPIETFYCHWTVSNGSINGSYQGWGLNTVNVTFSAGTSGSVLIDFEDDMFNVYFRSLLVTIEASVPTPDPVGFSDENYIYTITPQVEVGDITQITQNNQAIKDITYFDGLGRPMQSIGIKQSNSEKDIITHIGYDEIGRQDKDYLPYVPTVAGLEGSYRANDQEIATNDYYTTHFPTELGVIPNPYYQKLFEASPLNRVLQQAAPGEAWKLGSGNEIKFEYQTNTETTEVRLYTVTLTFANNTYTPTLQNLSPYYYAASELYKSVAKDENWKTIDGVNKTTEEFKDKQGRVLLKRTYNAAQKHDTYYVYDDYGNLTYVLPPKAEPHIAKPDATELTELCYQYKYDNRNRLVEKKIPGKGWESIVYDNLDRPVLTQDAIQKSTGEWLFTKYDVFGRVIYTGKFVDSRVRDSLQVDFNTKTAAQNYEVKLPTGTSNLGIEYSNDNFPNTSLEVLTVNYYDNYNFAKSIDLGNTEISYGITSTDKLNGLATGSKVKVLTTSDWITTIMYYDNKSRPIYVHSENDYLKTVDIIESKLDFVGKVLETKATHSKTGHLDVVTEDTFIYDHVGRLLTQSQVINSETINKELIAENTYDELGQLESKGVGNVAISNTRLQTVDYTYNIRGWLKQINNPISLGTDLFSFKIGYNEGTNPLYNGNISLTQWKTANIDTSLKTYNYTYDALNRITSGIDNTGNYNLNSIVYDKNGNISNLSRQGHTNVDATTFGLMDNLVYTYQTSSNKLIKVLDNGNDTYGFKDGANVTTEYTYDVNGNMIIDANKGIINISYNHLNLPSQVTFAADKYIDYIYDATGMKLQKIVTDTGNSTKTNYAGNYIYEEAAGIEELKFFNQPEGYVEPDGSGGFDYVYQYKDHLGNIRLSYSDLDLNGSIDPNTEILQERNNYPFGMEHRGYNNVVIGTENNHKTFQGQEINKELGLNWLSFKYRNYDPAIGRFMSIDPLAEDYVYNSTYAFAENRVMDGIELEGLEWKSIKSEDGKSTTMQLTVQLYNDAGLDAKQLKSLKADITKQFAASFTGGEFTGELVINDAAKAEGDFLVTLTEKTSTPVLDKAGNPTGQKTYKGGKAGALAKTQNNNFEVTAKTDGKTRSNTDVSRSFSHEAGHTAGLRHPWDKKQTVTDITQGGAGVTNKTVRSNLMNSDGNTTTSNRSHSGTKTTSGQLKSIDKIIRGQQK